jgi:small-conductance mechanosensitive channel
MDIHQAIILRIHKDFERLGIQFAYPTQRVILDRAVRPANTGTPPRTSGSAGGEARSRQLSST